MKKLTALVLTAVLVAVPVTVVADEGPGSRCNGHMCPVARAATSNGYKVVATLPLTNVTAGEFLT